MKNLQLRTKFLLSLLAISAGLTAGTLLLVRQRVQFQVREALREDLRNSVNAYEVLEKQRQGSFTQSAHLIADLPYFRAVMKSKDNATIDAGSLSIWRLSGSELLILADRSGKITALHTSSPDFTLEEAQAEMRRALDGARSKDWWLNSGRLYEIWIQPVHLADASNSNPAGYLVVGDAIDDQTAQDFRSVASSEIVFGAGTRIFAGTLNPAARLEFSNLDPSGVSSSLDAPREIQLGNEHFLVTSVRLSGEGQFPVSMSVLKSVDKASLFLSNLNRVLVILGLFSVLLGSVLVALISKSFMKPLANLVSGVRALEGGNYLYPLAAEGKDEVGEVTRAFVAMRGTLANAQKEQQLLEQRLRQAHKMEAVGRLAGGVAHDFNNLLTIIRGHSDLLLERGGENTPHRNSVEQIQKAADRAVSMTRQLLAFSRMQMLQPRVIDLNAVVADMGKMLPRLIGEHIEYVFVSETKPAHVKADPGQVEQVVMNLAVNARDAMPNGGRLTVQVRAVELSADEAGKRSPMSPGPYVLLSISDTGFGMDEDIKAHIFEPFFTTKQIGKGTGLGLATVYGIVKQSGGFIWVDSAPGKGAKFEIYLPQVPDAIAAKKQESRPASLPRGSETVLVVEDEDGVRELAAEFLRTNGYSVLEARDGMEAEEVAKRHAGVIHVLLTDMIMPRMGGAELVKRMKARQPGTKVILMTGYSDYLKVQVDGSGTEFAMLQKPFSMNSLVAAVRDVLVANQKAEGTEIKVF